MGATAVQVPQGCIRCSVLSIHPIMSFFTPPYLFGHTPFPGVQLLHHLEVLPSWQKVVVVRSTTCVPGFHFPANHRQGNLTRDRCRILPWALLYRSLSTRCHSSLGPFRSGDSTRLRNYFRKAGLAFVKKKT